MNFALKNEYLPQYTVSDWEQWEGHWELINGVPYAMSPLPGRRHQRVSARITTELQLKITFDACHAYPPIDWKIDENTVLAPDVSVVCGEWETHQLTYPPVIIFEILSPSTAIKDRNLKYEVYELKGVKYYVIVDVHQHTAEVYQLNNQKYGQAGVFSEEVYTFGWDDCLVDFDFSKIW